MQKLLIVMMLVGLAVLVLACESPAAQRELAEGRRRLDEATAYAREREADAAYYAEQSRVREAEANAALTRRNANLPYVMALMIVALALIGGTVAVVVALRRPVVGAAQQLAPPDWEYEILQRQLAERQMWHALATLNRRMQLAGGEAEIEVIDITQR